MQNDFIIWKPIFEYEGLYEISNTGLVKSIKFSNKPKILKANINKQTGYKYVCLFKDKQSKTKTIHRLVLQAFLPISNYKIMQCNHKNGIRTDNDVTNLEWVTRSENMHHACHVLGNVPHSKGKYGQDASRSIPIQQIDPKTGNIVACYHSLRQASENGFSLTAISNVLNGLSKTHKNFLWRKA